MSQSGGYFTESEYEVFTVFPPMNPAHMNFLCSFKGVRAPNFSEPFSYCELGCGQGYNLAMLAALYPNGRFVGIDFNGSQIKRAQAFVEAAGLDNIVFIDASFGDFAREADAEFDVIALHGVWTWVSREVRADIVKLVDKMLAPGGLLYVSMNMMPGWAPVVPLQRLIMDMRNESETRDPGAARAAFKAFFDRQPKSVAHSARAQQIFKTALNESENYFAHEFMNEAWEPIYFRDIAQPLSEVGLVYAAGGRVLDMLDSAYFTAAQREHLATVGDIAWRETLKDFYKDQTFRQDYFAREPAELTQADQLMRLASCPVSAVSMTNIRLDVIKGVEGDIKLDPLLHAAWLERLSAGPATVHELLQSPAGAGAGIATVLQTLIFMWSLGGIDIGFGDPYEREVHERAARFNAVALAQLGEQPQLQLASPVLRAPILTDLKDRTYLKAMREGADGARAILELAARTGAEVSRDGKAVSSKAARREVAEQDFANFRSGRFVMLRQLGVVDETGAVPLPAPAEERRSA